ncbi:polysaccharide biosynthesis protein [Ramlibacter sp. PS4R-6]|uniref:polysaccharide biosynthesis protein n=1 Tax=Ramlibacter sp. PS4R-6 TaxID=3133438 RepID=UPI0030A627E0
MRTRILQWPRPAKTLLVASLDVVLALLATWIAFTLRLDALHRPSADQAVIYAAAPVLAVGVFIAFGLYRAIFRFTGAATLKVTAGAVAVYAVLMSAVLWGTQAMGGQVIPRSLGITQPILFFLLVSGSRSVARFWLTGQHRRPVRRLLIYGAGEAGAQTAAALANSWQYSVTGFIDDDRTKVGRRINDARVFAPDEVPEAVEQHEITDILLALPGTSRERRNQIIDSLASLPVRLQTLPALEDLASGRVTVNDIRELEVEDLLGREPVAPDPALLAANCRGQVVLVTGAGGSIGSELCRVVLGQRPRTLLLLDHNEFGLYGIHSELQAQAAKQSLGVEIVPLLGSVQNLARLAEVCTAWKPDTVYHAAAYKHVPLVEHNPVEGVVNNVLGTLNAARAAIASGVRLFVLVSTDKAVRPTNVMGASKRIAELILQALSAQASVDFDGTAPVANTTRFAMVRFGNVLGSSGSVIPLFRSQIAAGGPVTVTHPDVTRFFMTIPEASQLVVQAGAMAQGGEVFVLDMGEPVRIIELARRMVALSGLTLRDERQPDGDVEIAVTGLRPGEKLHEELLIGDNPEATPHPRIMRAREDFLPWPELAGQLRRLADAAAAGDVIALREVLERLVPNAQLEGRVFDHVFQARQDAAAEPACAP